MENIIYSIIKGQTYKMYVVEDNLTCTGIPLPSLMLFNLEGNSSINDTRPSRVVGSLSGRSVA